MKRLQHWKRIWSLLMVFLLLLTAAGCGSEPQAASTVDEGKDGILVGFSFDNFIMERWERDRDIFVSRMNEFGASVNVQNANGSVEEQKKQIQYFIDKGCDVIVIVAVDCESLTEEVEKAHARGIKVVAYDRLIKGANVDLYITFDNEKVGRLMGETIAANVSDGANVICLTGPTTDNNVGYVYDGFLEEAQMKHLNILDTQYFEGWNQDLGYDYITQHTDILESIDAIMCGNDAVAGRVIQALAENRLAGKIVVVGQDADLESCQRIVEGTQFMTVYKPINELAESAASYTYLLAKNEDMSFVGSIHDGSNYIPYIAIKPYAVTKENMDELIIDSGFHRRDEVYLNTP